MTRKEFIKACGLLELSIPMQSILTSCNKSDMPPTDFEGSVLIIGAGAAGMAAGYLLSQQGIDFQIVEASSNHGGRMKQTTTFSDFPISLGAEWLHVSESELASIVNDTSTQITTELQGYQRQDHVGFYENGALTFTSISADFGSDLIDKKFINSSWFDFFEAYILPSITSKISFDTQIISIDYQADKVIATDNIGQTYEADKVIVTAPLKVLQQGAISFTPALPSSHLDAIQDAIIWGGIKVFIEFSEAFYPTYLTFPDSENDEGQRIYYDAAYGQNSDSNILGLVALGQQAIQYQSMEADAQKTFIINELDTIDGKASQTYIKHVVQDWDKEPFINGAYLADNAASNISNRLSKSVEDK